MINSELGIGQGSSTLHQRLPAWLKVHALPLIGSAVAGATMAYGYGLVSKVSADTIKAEPAWANTIALSSAILNFWLCAYASYGSYLYLYKEYYRNRRELDFRHNKPWIWMTAILGLVATFVSFINAHALTQLVMQDKQKLADFWNWPDLVVQIFVTAFRILMLARSLFVVSYGFINELRLKVPKLTEAIYCCAPEAKRVLQISNQYLRQHTQLQTEVTRAIKRGDLHWLNVIAEQLLSDPEAAVQNLPVSQALARTCSEFIWLCLSRGITLLSLGVSAYLSYQYVLVQAQMVAGGLGLINIQAPSATNLASIAAPFMFIFPLEWIKNGLQKIVELCLHALVDTVCLAYYLPAAWYHYQHGTSANFAWRWQLHAAAYQALQLGFAGFLLYVSYFAGAEYAQFLGESTWMVLCNGASGSLMNAVSAYQLGEKFAALSLLLINRLIHLVFKLEPTFIAKRLAASELLGNAILALSHAIVAQQLHPLRSNASAEATGLLSAAGQHLVTAKQRELTANLSRVRESQSVASILADPSLSQSPLRSPSAVGGPIAAHAGHVPGF